MTAFDRDGETVLQSVVPETGQVTTPSELPDAPESAGDAKTRLPPVIRLMGGAAGLIGANLHYSQPLLPVIALSLGVTPQAAGALPAVTQLGFALGLLLVLPLGDMLERRRLVVATAGTVSIALLGMSLAPNLPLLLIAAFGVGLLSVAPQLLAPFAAVLAPRGREGQASGTVLSGILLGVLLAKIVAGAVAATVGWRWLYAAAAVVMVLLALLLHRVLPISRSAQPPRYGELMRSTGRLLVEYPALRVHALLGAVTAALFMGFWATYAVHLNTQFGYGPFQAGLFGIAGIAGSLLAPLAGRAIDRGRFTVTVLGAIISAATAFAIFYVGGGSVVAMVIGVILLDAGTGISHSANQAAALRLAPERRSRVNTVYMFGYFAGGASGTAILTAASSRWDWNGVCVGGLILAGFAVLLTLVHARITRVTTA